MSGAIAIIPARLGSTRFPEKVLAAETGRPLIQHVWEAASKSGAVSRVVVATDSDRVERAVRAFGGEAVLTSADHPNGSSRLDEAAAALGLAKDQVIVNVQGDEPELEPGLIEAGVEALLSSGGGGRGEAHAATIASPFGAGENPADANLVKVVRRLDGEALYFSRSLVPMDRDGDGASDAAPLRHVGLYVYRRGYLATYVRLAPGPLERAEKLEQLRILEHGHRIAVAVRASERHGVDTPEQYAAFVRRWRSAPRGA